MKLGLENKTLIFTVAMLVVIFGTFGYLGLEAVNRSTELALSERLALAETVAANIDGAVNYSRTELEQMASRAAIPAGAVSGAPQPPPSQPSGPNSCLTMCHDRSRIDVSTVGMTDRSGRLLSVEPHQTISLDQEKLVSPAVKAALEQGKTTITEISSPLNPGELMISIATPVRQSDGTIQGALVMEINALDSVAAMIGSEASQAGGYHIQVIDDKGTLLTGDQGGTPLFSRSDHLSLVSSMLRTKQRGFLEHISGLGKDQEQHIIAFAPLKTLPWGIIVERQPDMTLLLPNLLRERMFVLGVLALVAALVMAWIAARRVVKPIAALTLASQRMASGNLEEPIQVRGEKELEMLARAFDNMRTKLRDSQALVAIWQRDLEHRVDQRTRELSSLIQASQELSASLDLGHVVQVIVSRAGELFPDADAGVLFLWDPKASSLISAASFGFKPGLPAPFSFKSGEDYAGQVFEKAGGITVSPAHLSPQILTGISIENLHHLRPDALGFEAREAMAVPLIYQTKPIGSLVLYNLDGPSSFSTAALHLLQGLANQGAIAVENSRLFKEAALVGTLRELERMKTEFVARASHELRTPLTSIKSLVETLLRPELHLKPKDQKEFLENINRASDRLARIISDLLTISKIEAGKLDMRPVPTHLGSLASKVVEEFQPQSGDRTIKVAVPPDTLPVMADPDKLTDVLNNLLANSVRYSPPGSTITIAAENAGISTPSPGQAAAEPVVIVSVTDQGGGIPVEEQSKLFQRFSRPDVPSSRTVPGVGLGLYICRSYVEAMGGRIWVKSSPGAGATFSFTLPSADKGSVPPEGLEKSTFESRYERLAESVRRRKEHSGTSILVVDDEPDVARTVAVNLEARGFKVLTAVNGEDGLKLARENPPGVAVLDIMLPDIDGFEIARRLKDEPATRDIPIIFISARAQKEDQIRGIEAGAAEYITKPFSTEELCRAVEGVLRKKRHQNLTKGET